MTPIGQAMEEVYCVHSSSEYRVEPPAFLLLFPYRPDPTPCLRSVHPVSWPPQPLAAAKLAARTSHAKSQQFSSFMRERPWWDVGAHASSVASRDPRARRRPSAGVARRNVNPRIRPSSKVSPRRQHQHPRATHHEPVYTKPHTPPHHGCRLQLCPRPAKGQIFRRGGDTRHHTECARVHRGAVQPGREAATGPTIWPANWLATAHCRGFRRWRCVNPHLPSGALEY